MYDDRGDYTRGVGCHSDSPPHIVTMNVTGGLKICSGKRCNVCGCDEPHARPLAYGRQITVGRFRCASLRSGIRCTVIRTGRGFLISRSGVRRVRP